MHSIYNLWSGHQLPWARLLPYSFVLPFHQYWNYAFNMLPKASNDDESLPNFSKLFMGFFFNVTSLKHFLFQLFMFIMQIAQPSIALPTCKYEIFTHIIHLSIYGTSKISSSAFLSNTHTHLAPLIFPFSCK